MWVSGNGGSDCAHVLLLLYIILQGLPRGTKNPGWDLPLDVSERERRESEEVIKVSQEVKVRKRGNRWEDQNLRVRLLEVRNLLFLFSYINCDQARLTGHRRRSSARKSVVINSSEAATNKAANFEP